MVEKGVGIKRAPQYASMQKLDAGAEDIPVTRGRYCDKDTKAGLCGGVWKGCLEVREGK
jgi:hypothetical protein